MLGYILFGLFIILVLYAYVDHNGHFSATSSAIQQIWSGNCRLSCRNAKAMQPRDRFVRTDDGGTSSQIDSGYQDNCICASCPCGLVENVLQTCSPITRLYSTIVGAMFLAFYDLIKACTDLYEKAQEQISKPRTEGRKISQVGTVTQVTNFMFDDISKNVIMRAADRDPDSEPGTSNGQKVGKKEEVRTRDERSEDFPGTSCPSCIEKGMTCIGRCPGEWTKKN